jgi:hypothetical protein
MVQLFNYTITDDETFENVFKDENLLLNHVVIPQNKYFEKHPTDSTVHIIILRGTLSIAIAEDDRVLYEKGVVINVSKGVVSVLGNPGPEITELMVIKSDLKD